MNKKKWISILLCLALVFTCITPVFADSNAWNGEDFSYDSAGTTITGLSALGKEKIKVNPDLVLPAEGPGGAIVALGDGVSYPAAGIFDYSDGTKNYTPASVVLPVTLEKIGKFTFAIDPSKTYEAKMTSIVFPEGLKEIGQAAFQNAKLTSVSIPDSVTTMGQGAFTGNGDLKTIKLSKNCKDIPQAAFSSGMSSTLSIKELIIPEGVETIGRQAFDTAKVEKVVFPSTLTTIGRDAFKNHQMTSVVIPGNVKNIERGAFSIANTALPKKLETVVLNEGLVKIDQSAFAKNNITEIYIPSTVTTLGKKAFENQTVVAKVTDATQVNLTNATNNPNLTLQHDSAAKAITAVKDDAALASAKVTYTGSELKPAVTITGLVEGTDFEVTYRDNVEVGTATAEVVGKGDYYGSFRLTFEIEAAPAPAPTPTPTPSVPVTGDTAPMALMVALMAVAAAGGFVAYRKRNN